MFDLAELKRVIPLVRASVPLTPQCAWPLLRARTGVEIVVKHENNTPIGAFKVRGGIVYFDRLKRARPQWGGGFNRSTQHYSAGALWHGAGTILPLSANILDIASVP